MYAASYPYFDFWYIKTLIYKNIILYDYFGNKLWWYENPINKRKNYNKEQL